MKDFVTSFLIAGEFNLVDINSVSGTLKNTTVTQTVVINNFEVDEDDFTADNLKPLTPLVGDRDDFEWDTDASIAFALDDSFELDFTGNYEVGTLAFSDLVLGTHQLDTPSDDAIFGAVTVVVGPVPEPSTTALLGLGGLALILRRRR
jgi:hypothetical protein